MLRTLVTATLFLAAIATTAEADAPGFRDITITDPTVDRTLSAVVWYPAVSTAKIESVGENAAFIGIPAIRDASPADGRHPLVVLSHGYGGSWRNLSWLAGELVAQGYIVAAANHPGTTTFDHRSEEAARLWERPRDLTRLIDALLADSALAGRIDARRIAAIGYSLGGWTVAALAGARVDAERFVADCKANASLRACRHAHELGLDRVGEARASLEGDLRDPRIAAFVSLDLGLARGFTPESLAQLNVPALVIAAGTDVGDMPAALESGYLASSLPRSVTEYVVIPDAMHFSFMQVCKPGAGEWIEKETPGDGVVCKDGGTRNREAIHHEVSQRIVTFLGAHLP
jgi:predicted dienelactone hydrolase